MFDPATRRLFFHDADEALRWFSINDGVMGGLSYSEFRLATDDGHPTACFEGVTSLANGGGFASVRREPDAFEAALQGAGGLSLCVRGDGRCYQLRVKSRRLDPDSAYRGVITPDTCWQTLSLDWSAFSAVRRGKRLTEAPRLAGEDITAIGLMVVDGEAGPFCLSLRWLEAMT